MPAKKTTTTKKSKTSVTKLGSSIAVTGDATIQTLTFERRKKKTVQEKPPEDSKKKQQPKKGAVKSTRKQERPVPPKVTKEPKLIAVSLDAKGAASVSRYAGLFFLFVGLCFASRALIFMHYEVERIGLVNFDAPIRMQAQTISSGTLSTIDTTSDDALSTDVISTNSVSGGTTSESGSGTTTTTSTATTTAPQPVDDTSTVEPAPTSSMVQPPVSVSIRSDQPVVGPFETRVDVRHAKLVEIFIVPYTAMTERYLGKALRVDDARWILKYDSRSIPNGEYKLFARITNEYGSYRSSGSTLRVKNPTALPQPVATTSDSATSASTTVTSSSTPATTGSTDEISDAANAFNQSEPQPSLTEEIVAVVQPKTTITPIAPTATTNSTTSTNRVASTDATAANDQDDDEAEESIPPEPVDPVIDNRALGFLIETEAEFNELLNVLAVALRSGDVAGVDRVRARIAEFERQRLDRVATDLLPEDATDDTGRVRDRLKVLINDAVQRTERRERIILDRFGEKVTRDSDRDGVSDYDEQKIYNTDPFKGDTDNDGFADGAEILGGYDPRDDRGEAPVVYESPKEVGTVRNDILAVDTLRIIEQDASSTTIATGTKNVLLSGKALPSSFVTLYIFSTPTIVTVKTNDDGSWNYVLDKELDDGAHEIYVGMTDNAGKIIAKSEPFRFVKTAEAYTIGSTDISPTVETVSETRLFSESVFGLVASLGVVMIGLILLLVGMYFSKREKAVVASAEPQALGSV